MDGPVSEFGGELVESSDDNADENAPAVIIDATLRVDDLLKPIAPSSEL